MSLQDRLRRVFNDGFRVGDIASPLPSFDGEQEAATVARRMDAELAGLRTAGMVSGWVRRGELTRDRAQSAMRLFDPEQVLENDVGLADAVHALDRHEICFVANMGQVQGYVRRADLHKPPARTWLFGMITIIEMYMSRSIEEDDDWDVIVTLVERLDRILTRV